MPAPLVRTADPYRDLDVIDARARRFNQTVVGTLSLLAVASGWWPILAVPAVHRLPFPDGAAASGRAPGQRDRRA